MSTLGEVIVEIEPPRNIPERKAEVTPPLPTAPFKINTNIASNFFGSKWFPWTIIAFYGVVRLWSWMVGK